MPRTFEPEYGTPDEENPEWTKEMWAKARRFQDMPADFQAALRKMQERLKDERARNVPLKEVTTLALSSDVLEAIKATGVDWEDKVDEVLREKFVNKAA